jgi:hypothetical protein
MRSFKRTTALFALTLGLVVSVPCAGVLFAQDSGVERRFPNTKAEVDGAVQTLQSSLKGRLPTLDGFVERPGDPVERFDRGYYECSVQVTPDANGQTLARITPKITAWYSDPSGAQSGYRVLVSNGRIETDLLDQLSALLGRKTPIEAPGPRPLRPSPLLTGPTLGPISGSSSVLAAAPTSAPGDADLNSLRQKRQEAEKRAKSLEGQVRDLEEILRSQTHPENLAVVRKSGTPVLSQPGGAALLTTEANDEFEILRVTRDWVHVQISGASRGWIQRSQLDLPEGFAQTAKTEGPSREVPDAGFRVSREETHPFTGTWPQLQGKNVKIVWVEPAGDSQSKPLSADAKRKFIESVFSSTYKEPTSSSGPVDGIVIVFDSADGGQVSAARSTLAQWTAGTMSDDAFWKQCLIDPPDFFQNAQRPKPAETAPPAASRGHG